MVNKHRCALESEYSIVHFRRYTIIGYTVSCADQEGGGGGQEVQTPLKNHKNIGFLSNTGPYPLNNHKATKPAFNVGPSLAHQRNTISMVFRWPADDGPLLVAFGSPHQLLFLKKQKQRQSRTPSEKTFWIRA